MKVFLIATIAIVCMFSYAFAAGVMLEKVYEVDLPKDEIYARCLQWMAETFTDSKELIQYQDEAQGKIIGKGVASYTTSFIPVSIPCKFTMIVDIKEGKYRVRFQDYYGLYGADLDNPVDIGDKSLKSREYKKYVDEVNDMLSDLSDDMYKQVFIGDRDF